MATQVMLRRIVSRYEPMPEVPGFPKGLIWNAKMGAKALWKILEHEPQEVFGTLLLGPDLGILGYQEITRGDLHSTLMPPARFSLAPALREGASGVVLCHNHPDTQTPVEASAPDKESTQKLVRAGGILGIVVADSIVVGATGFYSMRDGNGMTWEETDRWIDHHPDQIKVP